MDSSRSRGGFARLTAALAACGLTVMAFAGTASAAPVAHGHIVHLVKPSLRANAAQSTNWFGYNQGTLEQGGKLFSSITGEWTVPAAPQHNSGHAAASPARSRIGDGVS